MQNTGKKADNSLNVEVNVIHSPKKTKCFLKKKFRGDVFLWRFLRA
jgi:hypothetical protein